MREIISTASYPQGSMQLPTMNIHMDPSSDISVEQFQQAMGGEIIPEMVQAMGGAIQRAQLHQFDINQLRDVLQSIVTDVIINKAVPIMVDDIVSALIPSVVQATSTESGHDPSSSTYRSLPVQAESSESRNLALYFVSHLPGDGLYTLTNIQEHEGASLKVELRDSSGSKVELGPESCARIKLYVLRGDFDAEDRDDWTAHDFNQNVARPRENKGPLLKGKCEIHLSNGVACFDEIAFTDNSKSRINGKFRIGARVVKGLPPGVMVRDAISEVFKVKERRLKFYSKHKTPSLEDGTDSLKHIGKILSQKLAVKQVYTVKDFLQLFKSYPDQLQKILQINGNKWSELVSFANSCPLTDKGYRYYDKDSNSTVLLDCVFNIVGVAFNGQAFQPYGNLNVSQQNLAYKMRHAAYEKRHELPSIDIPGNWTSMEVEQETSFSQSVDGAELEGLLASELREPRTYQSQTSCFLHHNFNTPPNATFFENVEACLISGQFRMAHVNNSPVTLSNANTNAALDKVCSSNVGFDRFKRTRLV